MGAVRILAPALAGLLLFRFVPIVISLVGGLFSTGLTGETAFAGLGNYQGLVDDPAFWHSVRVTLLFNVIINPLQVVLAFLLALLMVRPGRGVGFTLMRYFGWTDTYGALILPEVASGLSIFLFRQFFAAVPKELYEAGRIDGATWWQVYWRLVLPISGPTIATAALMQFVQQWDAFFWPVVAASSPDKVMIQVAIARHANLKTANWGGLFASASVSVLVAALPFLLLQRFYVRTLMHSGGK